MWHWYSNQSDCHAHIKMEIPKKCSPWTYIFKIIRTRILWLFHGRETETHTAALSIFFTFKRLMRNKIENIIYWENWYLDISNTINTKIFLKSSIYIICDTWAKYLTLDWCYLIINMKSHEHYIAYRRLEK